MKIRELLSDESKWCKNVTARDINGVPVNEDSEDAVCRCLGSAFNLAYKGQEKSAVESAWYKIYTAIGGMAFCRWNDAPERTFKEVKELVDRLDV
jgi:hypothetical protein